MDACVRSAGHFFRCAFTPALLCVVALQAVAVTKIPAPRDLPAGEAAGCSKVEGYVVDGEESLIVTTAECNGTPRAWLSKPPRGQNVANTDPSLVLDRLSVDKPRSAAYLFSSGPYCSVDGKELQWVAVYDWRKRKKIGVREGAIRQAWVVDPAARRFVPAPRPLIQKATCHAGDDE